MAYINGKKVCLFSVRCGNISGTDVPDTPEVPPEVSPYTVSGTWVFNDRLSFSDIISQKIQFATSYISDTGSTIGYHASKISLNNYVNVGGDSRWCMWFHIEKEYGGTASVQFYVDYPDDRNPWHSTTYPDCKTITFDGDQTVSKEFYTWFTSNAVRQEETEYTLSGTWLFNEDIVGYVPPSGTTSVRLTFRDSNGELYCGIANTQGEHDIAYYSQVLYETYVDVYTRSSWVDESYRTITFTRTHTVSAEFYEWFTANAKPSVSDLSGTTWYVPSGWRCEAQSGSFVVNGSVDGDTFEKISLGWGGSATWIAEKNAISFKYPSGSGSPHRKICYNSSGFTISITGGTDVTNPDLIAWLSEWGELQ